MEISIDKAINAITMENDSPHDWLEPLSSGKEGGRKNREQEETKRRKKLETVQTTVREESLLDDLL